ncbi:MAG: transcriptional regulator [Chthonomonadaceae bacterium]|nr:transcriptional regulator [Chthonomonadaceae bacterium]
MSIGSDNLPDPSAEKSLGELELELLRWIAQQGPATVGETFEGYGTPRGLARSTVVTVMERLRLKGYLTRKKQDGVFRYASPVGQEALMGGLVQRFIEKTLAGSLSPLLAYFAKGQKLSAEEMSQLEGLISKLESEKAPPETTETIREEKEDRR